MCHMPSAPFMASFLSETGELGGAAARNAAFPAFVEGRNAARARLLILLPVR